MSVSYKRGFTLIELLVVIAIIGLLAAVVLASVGGARSKGVDASVKGELSSIRSQAELYASNNSNQYTNVCTAAGGISAMLTNAASTTGATVGAVGALENSTSVYCNATAGAWQVQAPLSATTNAYWCVDSTGQSKQEAAAAAANATACI
jgi:type IV pilus assembly protein PilA